jgi:hypothetical protein
MYFQVEPAISGGMWLLESSGWNELAMRYVNLSTMASEYAINFFDPTPSIIKDYNNLMFRAGVTTAHWTNLTQLMDPGLSARQEIAFQDRVSWHRASSNPTWTIAA